MAALLAMFGWTVHIVDGVVVWLHASGVVIYNQGPTAGLPPTN